MTIPAKRLVSALLVSQAATQADKIMEENPAVKEGWLDQVRTSKASKAAGGTILFLTDWDWVPAFFIWYHGGGHLLQRTTP